MTTSIISNFFFPSVIDVTNGTVRSTVGIQLIPGALGAGAHVQVNFKYIPFGFVIGETGAVVDTFTDATPNYASSSYDVFGGYPAGKYTIDNLELWDKAGHYTAYNADQLAAMGFQNSFTIVDNLAPTAPTSVSIAHSTNGVIDGNAVTVQGYALPGEKISVSYKDTIQHTVGTTYADATGHWSITSQALSEGHYTQVVATAADSAGHVSTYSTPLDFYVQKAPQKPVLHIAGLDDGSVDIAHPLVWGVGPADSKIALYDGSTLLGTVQSDDYGWWGVNAYTVPLGQHALTAVVTDQFGRVSPISDTLNFNLAAADRGINFTVQTLTNQAGLAADQTKVQMVLDAVSALISNAIDGTETITLDVTGRSDMDANAIASAGSTFKDAIGDGLPQITRADLNLSPDFITALNANLPTDMSHYTVEVLAHEMLHVLGFNHNDAPFANDTVVKDGISYFAGANATALNGGAVELSADGSHVADETDVISAHGDPSEQRFSDSNQDSPFSAVSLAILKDLGYQNTDTLVSADGHTFLPGDGKAGHNQIIGTDTGIDTVFIDGKSADYTLRATANGYSLTDTVGNQGTELLSKIEHIQFADQDAYYFAGKGYTQITGTNAGLDTLIVSGKASGYVLGTTSTGYSLTDKSGVIATEQLTNIDRIEFSDQGVALDTGRGQVGGEVYRMYQAAFDRAPDSAGLGFWIDKMEHGWTLSEVASAFKTSAEFTRLYGDNLSDSAYITQLYANVLHRAPENGAVDFWVDQINKGVARGDVLVQFSESNENVANLVGAIQHGFTYTPFIS